MENKYKHMDYIQSAISRMASNSFYLKGWNVTIIAAIVALSFKESDWRIYACALALNIVFWVLDAYYLKQEKLFRELYNKVSKIRNYSTSHVHMMLSIALSRMIDKCESVFFLNSENSISIAEEISKERTASPWIYNELSLADMIKIRPINCYRDEFLQFSHRAYDAVNESSSLQIKYEVDKILRSFISLSKYDLISCAKEWRANNKSFQSALDYIYLSKDIIIKQDVLIS